MKLMVRIGTIDMDGYWGRDEHPEESDEGRTGCLLSFATEEDIDVYRVRLEDGRIVELVSDEIESVTMEREICSSGWTGDRCTKSLRHKGFHSNE